MVFRPDPSQNMHKRYAWSSKRSRLPYSMTSGKRSLLRQKRKKKKKKLKEDREEIFEALEKLGHEPFYQVLDGTKQSLFSLSRCGANLIFNLTESYAGDDTMDMNIAAYMDLIGMPYTGTGPRGLFL